MKTVGTFTVAEGRRVPFVLTYYPSFRDLPPKVDAEQALVDTTTFWRDWIGRCEYEGDGHDAVHRSLIVLKALTFAPTGGIVAAPTTSLPEHIGGVRNWDYRFCWVRDATLTLIALLSAGYAEEADQWRTWLLRAAAGNPETCRSCTASPASSASSSSSSTGFPATRDRLRCAPGTLRASRCSSTSTAS